MIGQRLDRTVARDNGRKNRARSCSIHNDLAFSSPLLAIERLVDESSCDILENDFVISVIGRVDEGIQDPPRQRRFLHAAHSFEHIYYSS